MKASLYIMKKKKVKTKDCTDSSTTITIPMWVIPGNPNYTINPYERLK